MTVAQLFKRSEYGLVIDWGFHQADRWVSAFGPYLVSAFIRRFDPVIIRSGLEYELHRGRVKYLFSLEPGWSAPRIRYRKRPGQKVCMLVSDPHNKVGWLQDYVGENGIDYVLCPYLKPFFLHFPAFPQERYVHFPWAVPDEFVTDDPITARSNEVAIFGGRLGDAYDVRNWCRAQEGITEYDNSGCENKILTHAEYFSWLKRFDAVVAAGSSNPIYDLVTPKYFEIASSGALLMGQECADLGALGFDAGNAVIFTKETFLPEVRHYRENPAAYLSRRAEGRSLVRKRHLISHRIEQIEKLFSPMKETP